MIIQRSRKWSNWDLRPLESHWGRQSCFDECEDHLKISHEDHSGHVRQDHSKITQTSSKFYNREPSSSSFGN